MNINDNIADALTTARKLREKFLGDSSRPGWHFVMPEDIGIPGDSNGCFYANGLYHLMYLYQCREDSFRWGHVTSTDLLHWRHHPDALIPDEGRMPGGNAADSGIFSGGAFVDSDGTAWLSYWALPKEGVGGLRLAYSRDIDNEYEKWEKMPDYACVSTEFGLTLLDDGRYIGCADPSNIWAKDGMYYMQAGNLLVLNKFRDDSNAPEYHGDWTDLYRSRDMIHWEYMHRFYDRASLKTPDTFMPPQDGEDDMCPSFLPLYTRDGGETGKYLQLFISHNRGCRYYIGEYDTEHDIFIPELHGRMTWTDNSYFAPEALVTPDNRQITWVWFNEEFDGAHELEAGWSGIYGMPRHLWYDEKRKCLGMSPAREMRTLRYDSGSTPRGDSCEYRAVFDHGNADKAGIKVRVGGGCETVIYYDDAAGTLVFDASNSGKRGRCAIERAPFKLDDGEKLKLDVYVDKSIIEVYANHRQAIARKIYPEPDALGVEIQGKPEKVRMWSIMPCNPY